jgi:hypothetical protein
MSELLTRYGVCCCSRVLDWIVSCLAVTVHVCCCDGQSLEMSPRNTAADDDEDNDENDLPADDFQHMPDNDDDDADEGDNRASECAD